MFLRSPKLEKQFRRACGIPSNEIPIVVLLAGHYPEENKYYTPMSVRLNLT